MSVYQEVIDELREINKTGTGHLRRRTVSYEPVAPIKEYKPHEIKKIRQKRNHAQSLFTFAQGHEYVPTENCTTIQSAHEFPQK